MRPKITLNWGSGGSYPAGGSRWSATPTEVVPVGSYFTPNQGAPAQYVNYLFNAADKDLNALADGTGQGDVINWTTLTTSGPSYYFPSSLFWNAQRQSWMFLGWGVTGHLAITESYDGGTTWTTSNLGSIPGGTGIIPLSGVSGSSVFANGGAAKTLIVCLGETNTRTVGSWATIALPSASHVYAAGFINSTQINALVLLAQDGTTTNLYVADDQTSPTAWTRVENQTCTTSAASAGYGMHNYLAEGNGFILGISQGMNAIPAISYILGDYTGGPVTWSKGFTSLGTTLTTTTVALGLFFDPGNSVFVAVFHDTATPGTVLVATSPNGTTWTLRSTTDFTLSTWFLSSVAGASNAKIVDNNGGNVQGQSVTMMGETLVAVVSVSSTQDRLVYSQDFGVTWHNVPDFIGASNGTAPLLAHSATRLLYLPGATGTPVTTPTMYRTTATSQGELFNS